MFILQFNELNHIITTKSCGLIELIKHSKLNQLQARSTKQPSL